MFEVRACGWMEVCMFGSPDRDDDGAKCKSYPHCFGQSMAADAEKQTWLVVLAHLQWCGLFLRSSLNRLA